MKKDHVYANSDERRNELVEQMKDSVYGIGYIDGTEKITQLNRPLDNNLMKQVEYLTNMLYSQLGITQSILDGTADEQTLLNYHTRTQLQTIKFFRDPFKLVPINSMAEVADKFTRNEIMTSNEFRQVIGMKPSSDPKADQLRNSNLNQPDEQTTPLEIPKSENDSKNFGDTPLSEV